MVICGSIVARNNYEEFTITCSLCKNETSIVEWEKFVLHIKDSHRPVELEEDKFEKLPYSENKNPILEEPFKSDGDGISDCLNEAAIVDLPMSDDGDQFDTDNETGDDETFEECESGNAGSETDTGTKSFPPIRKFNPTFYRRHPRITKFIELYKSHPCLWDPKDASYRNKEMRTSAYNTMLEQLKSNINIHLTHFRLKKCISNLHRQYAGVTRRKQTQKLTKVTLQYHDTYKFLAKRGDIDDDSEAEAEDEKIKLIFTETNQLTQQFIQIYELFPQLFDPEHKDYRNLAARKASYEEMAQLLRNSGVMPENNITGSDVYESVLCLRKWYCRKIKGLTEGLTEGLGNAEKQFLEKCKSYLRTTTFRLKLPCEVCQAIFNTDHALQAHLYKVHKQGEFPFKCDLCSGSFERRCNLQQHIQRVHVGKMFKCSHCERSFAFLHQLNIHLRTHEDSHIAKPFVCEFCGKSFKQKIQMTTHVTAVHTKVRAYKCEMCPKDFLTKRDLKDHVKAHLNIRDKVCEICQKAFTNANALVKHRHIHREKTIQCTLCSTRFSERVSLGVHMKRTHKIIRNIPKE
ncbi:zinc finger protein 420 [Scaptodrosophila lebanonensis]|uniref:Zinc finger protein 420 n=1 Tax=Drosophila lebanonensis TaxID=7225 RepID=A0A6J2T0R2_DROLE|nr:zinc finger protein 420 [Scaptodrosophila lebanonensis]